MKQSVDKILEWVSYDPDTGIFRWKKTSGRGYAGEVAGGAHSKGYLYITIRGVPYLAHRLAWYLTHGSFPRQQIDHKNGDKRDNRIVNLRLATNQQNHANRGPQRNSSTGVKGVYWFKPNRQWKAQICVSGKSIVLGYFHDFDDAVRCRKAAELKYHGDWKHEGPATVAYGP